MITKSDHAASCPFPSSPGAPNNFGPLNESGERKTETRGPVPSADIVLTPQLFVT